MTAVTIQSNKIVLSDVKDKSVLLEPSYGKNSNELFSQLNKRKDSLTALDSGN